MVMGALILYLLMLDSIVVTCFVVSWLSMMGSRMLEVFFLCRMRTLVLYIVLVLIFINILSGLGSGVGICCVISSLGLCRTAASIGSFCSSGGASRWFRLPVRGFAGRPAGQP